MSNTESPLPVFLSMKETARMLGVSRQYIHRIIKDRRGPPVYTYAKRFRFRKDELLDWINTTKR